MSRLTPELMAICTGAAMSRAVASYNLAQEAADLYGINTANRMGMWLANIGHETAGLLYREELWGPTDAQKRYEGRKDLGNTQLGDGYRYRGRAWFQTTGRANYLRLTQRLRGRWPQMQVPDFVEEPDMLAQIQWAAVSAADYHEMRGLNRFADTGDFDGYCDTVNIGRKTSTEGDSNGWKHRLALWTAARPALILAGFATP